MGRRQDGPSLKGPVVDPELGEVEVEADVKDGNKDRVKDGVMGKVGV